VVTASGRDRYPRLPPKPHPRVAPSRSAPASSLARPASMIAS
jgi:hypothetical protein